MSSERRREVSLFDVVDEASLSAKLGSLTTGAAATLLPATINRWTGRTYSQRYFEIFEKRKTLPVWRKKDEFLQVLKDNQTLILVGETGCGKTTQLGCY